MNIKFITLGVATALGVGLFHLQGADQSIDEDVSSPDGPVTYKPRYL